MSRQVGIETILKPAYVDVLHPSQPGRFRMPAGSDDNIVSAMSYEGNAGDLFVCSYPKCGSTWLLNIIWRILHGGNGMTGNIRDHIPFLEFDGAEKVVDSHPTDEYKLIKTHFPFSWTPRHPKARYIFIAREPKDVCVSLFYHVVGFEGYNWSEGRFDHLLETFLDGDAECCDYFEMLDQWLGTEDSKSVHVMLYEDLIKNTKEEIRRLARFIGEKWEEKLLTENESILDTIIAKTTLVKMKEEDKQWYKSKRSIPFVRKGIIGDWKNHMTAKQAERFDKKTEKLVLKYPFLKTWNVGKTGSTLSS